MGIRKDLLVHKQKTIESFGLVKADISSINASIDHVKNSLVSIELRLSAFDNEVLSLKKYMEASISEASMQRASTLKIQSKMSEIGNTITGTTGIVNSIRDRINGIFAQIKKISKAIADHKGIIENMKSKINSQFISGRKSSAKIKNFDKEIKKLRNLVNAKIKTTKTADLELEKKISSQRRRIAQLNRKIEGRKILKKVSIKRKILKKIAPKKKVTITTKKETPTKKEIYQVIKEKNPLI